MKITVKVPEVVPVGQAVSYNTYYDGRPSQPTKVRTLYDVQPADFTVLDYDFKAAHRAKHAGAAVAVSALAFVAAPVVLTLVFPLAILVRVARVVAEEVASVGDVLRYELPPFFRHASRDIADFIREVVS